MSVAAVPQRGELQADDADPVVEVLAELALLDQARAGSRWSTSGTGRRRSAVVAVAVLELAVLQGAEELEPGGSGRAATSSRNRVPPCAWCELARPVGLGVGPARCVPRRRCRSCSASGLGQGRAVEDDERLSRREPRLWIIRARRALPVPCSPRISTGVRVGAIVPASSIACRRLGSSPTIPSSRASLVGSGPGRGRAWRAVAWPPLP